VGLGTVVGIRVNDWGRSMRSSTIVLSVACSALWLTVACERPSGSSSSATAGQAPAAAASDGIGGTNVVAVPPDSPQFKQLRVEAVRARDVVADEVVAPGRVGVNPNRVSRVLPPVQGRVLEVMAKLGDSVDQGQPLLSLDSPDADAAIATNFQAEATERQTKFALQKADLDFRRAKELFTFQGIAEKDLLQAQNDQATATSNYEIAQAVREQARRKLELLGLRPGEFHQPTVVRAPISGKVLEVNVTRGEFRGAVASHSDTTTAPLMTIADLSTVWMFSDVPEPYIRFIRVGEPVEITLVAFPGEVLRGHVAQIADMLDPQTRALRVHVELPNPGGRFRPEMFGSIRHAGAVRSLPVVPLAAVVQEYGVTVVFVELTPGRFERRQITIGPRRGDVVAALTGLKVDERVVVAGAMLLKGQ
jgi:cobalt-zinc-cadmium efflux system membrane fusion protein